MDIRFDMIACYVVRAVGGSHEFLQLRRAPGEFMAGVWHTVSGRIEPMRRHGRPRCANCAEETGLSPLEFYQIDRVNIFYVASTDTLWHCVGFGALVDADVPIRLNEEHDSFRWVARDAVRERFLWPGDREAVAEVCDTILDNGPAKPFLRIALP